MSLPDDTAPNLQRSIQSYYPWLSIGTSLLAIFLLTAAYEPTLRDYYQLPDIFQTEYIAASIVATLGIIYLLDINLYLRRKTKNTKALSQLQNQLEAAWQAKAKQQRRANTLSDSTEKLKGFISDKLLEFLDYDEKFIHFKGIAEEVRHNGVISYDKVQTALHKAIEQQRYLAIYEQSEQSEENPDPSTQTLEALSQYQTAINAMHYLWALLDLSTAENMALHIGNQLIECEENYYQLHLDSERSLESTQSIPVAPTFSPQIASLLTISLQSDEAEIKNLISLAKINHSVLDEPFEFSNELFRIRLLPTPELLGNHNHIILLLENLLKNALFFSKKVAYQQQTDRIGIGCQPQENQAQFTIYNRGPTIPEEEIDAIFQLGYSTRRSKQHHGKGLGLFFSNEIVNGYQGNISIQNIYPKMQALRLELLLENDESIQLDIMADQNEGRMMLYSDQVNDVASAPENALLASTQIVDEKPSWQKMLHLEPTIPIKQIDLLDKDNSDSRLTLAIDKTKAYEQLFPLDRLMPSWKLKLSVYKKQHKLTITPLDNAGVCFQVLIPTAESLLESEQI